MWVWYCLWILWFIAGKWKAWYIYSHGNTLFKAAVFQMLLFFVHFHLWLLEWKYIWIHYLARELTKIASHGRTDCEHFGMEVPEFPRVAELQEDIVNTEGTWSLFEEFTNGMQDLAKEDWISFRWQFHTKKNLQKLSKNLSKIYMNFLFASFEKHSVFHIKLALRTSPFTVLCLIRLIMMFAEVVTTCLKST